MEENLGLTAEMAAVMAANSAIFYSIPGFKKASEERMALETKLSEKQDEGLEKANRMMDMFIHKVALACFPEETWGLEKVTLENYQGVYSNFDYAVSNAYLKVVKMKNPFKRWHYVTKFRNAMMDNFGIVTRERETLNTYSKLMASFHTRYLENIKVWDSLEYWFDLPWLQLEEQNFKKQLEKDLSNLDLLALWNDGNEDDVINKCAEIIIQYVVTVKGVAKDEMKELRSICGGDEWQPNPGIYRYSEEEGSWAFVTESE